MTRALPSLLLLVGVLGIPNRGAAEPDAGTPPSAPSPSGGVAGGLLVAPTRVVLDGRTRSAELTLINTGRQRATYRIDFIQLQMHENGQMVEVPANAPGEAPAEPLIRYSPRQVVLEPGIAQTIRMQVRKPADLPAGEYRSHLAFREVPSDDGAGPDTAQAKGVNVQLKVVYGVSIPVIVLQGQTAATAKLTHLALVTEKDSPPALRFKINREGNRSVYGNLTATLLRTGAPPVVVGLMNGIAVYTPNAFRTVSLQLKPPPGISLTGGRLQLRFSGAAQDEELARAELSVP